MDTTGRKTTLKDVARVCDVSPMTVSKMLNGKGGVSKETAKRIWKAIRELNYTPNLVAKSLRVNRTHTLGVVMSDSSELLFPKMIRGIVDEATALDYSVIITNSNQSREREDDSIRVLLNKRIDGLLLAAPFAVDKERIEKIRAFGIPLVLVMRASRLPVDYVTSDNVRGSYDMLRHLAERGFDDFHFFSLPKNHLSGEERLKGSRRALRELGLPFREERVRYLNGEIGAGYAAMRDLIDRGVRRGTFVCACDVIAVGVIQAALDAGIAIPDEIQVAGFDDIEMLDHLNAPLTTMRQQVYEMGREGVRLLLARMENRDLPFAQLRLSCELIKRKST